MGNLLSNLPLLQDVAAGGSGQMVSMLITFGAVILIFYFLILRPQNKQQKETKKMLENIKKGDRVSTIGGINGVIFSVKDQLVVLSVDENTKIEFSKSSIAKVIDTTKPESKNEIEDAKAKTKKGKK